MKKLILFAGLIGLLGIVLLTRAQTPVGWNVIYVTNSSTTVPTNFTAGVNATTNIFATYVTILGKPSPRGVNISTCYIGTTNVNDSQPYPIAAGAEVVLRVPENKRFNLKEWWVDVGSANDGLTIIYQ